jgi:hypothetical protein
MTISARYLAALACAAVFACFPAHASILVFNADLNSSQVVAGSASNAAGFETVTIDTALKTVTIDLTWSGLSGPSDETHLHNGLPGQVTNFNYFDEILGTVDSDPSRSVPCPWNDGLYVNCAPASGSLHDVDTITSGFFDASTFDALVAVFESSGMYTDMHTQLYPDGEIRGQLIEQVPEPATIGLVFLGIATIAISRRYSKKAQVAH